MIIADDFGLDVSHDAVILALLKDGAIDGTSVMVREDYDASLTSELSELRKKGTIQVGLHLNLTEPLPGFDKFADILPLWRKLISGKILVTDIRASFERQLRQFETQFGFMPDFIDGHQHCHAIAQNWPALQHVVELAHDHHPCWVRSPAPNSFSAALTEQKRGGFKSWLVMVWGWNLRTRLHRHNVITNADFSGFIPYARIDGFEDKFSQMLHNRRADSLIMVHPGARDAKHEIAGHLNAIRAIEAKILSSFHAGRHP